ncbi:HetP family heterocyst commitment protein [Nostoc sp. UIC 10607]|uniref:HetP family heterocyst commitment protein n=2 Tax=Nostoc TaxID=1177 RepID=A0ABR8IFN0_9NOSO|nr:MULTISPECIES: HetP family heterocyst commitment protein [Nostoc]MBD2565540.1 HetP family heterocyst commitment protein [Nostoc linckia FACHB-391]MBD2649563.1 HetP family heterocyst commitment protein [Nostoc foliaceum FACHB-393]
MNYQISSSQKNFQKAISPEQLDQVMEAISDGRYSWACVLILRFVGYNPLHFIPQRTYSRLIKDNNHLPNSPASTTNQNQVNTKSSVTSSSGQASSQVLNMLKNLN